MLSGLWLKPLQQRSCILIPWELGDKKMERTQDWWTNAKPTGSFVVIFSCTRADRGRRMKRGWRWALGATRKRLSSDSIKTSIILDLCASKVSRNIILVFIKFWRLPIESRGSIKRGTSGNRYREFLFQRISHFSHLSFPESSSFDKRKEKEEEKSGRLVELTGGSLFHVLLPIFLCSPL